MKCPRCGKDVNIIPFGNRFIAVCCNQIIYVGYEPPSGDGPPDNSSDDPKLGKAR